MQHARCVPGELSHLDHGGILPEAELVLTEPMAAEDLTLMRVPLQCTDLPEHHCQKAIIHLRVVLQPDWIDYFSD